MYDFILYSVGGRAAAAGGRCPVRVPCCACPLLSDCPAAVVARLPRLGLDRHRHRRCEPYRSHHFGAATAWTTGLSFRPAYNVKATVAAVGCRLRPRNQTSRRLDLWRTVETGWLNTGHPRVRVCMILCLLLYFDIGLTTEFPKSLGKISQCVFVAKIRLMHNFRKLLLSSFL